MYKCILYIGTNLIKFFLTKKDIGCLKLNMTAENATDQHELVVDLITTHLLRCFILKCRNLAWLEWGEYQTLSANCLKQFVIRIDNITHAQTGCIQPSPFMLHPLLECELTWALHGIQLASDRPLLTQTNCREAPTKISLGRYRLRRHDARVGEGATLCSFSSPLFIPQFPFEFKTDFRHLIWDFRKAK